MGFAPGTGVRVPPHPPAPGSASVALKSGAAGQPRRTGNRAAVPVRGPAGIDHPGLLPSLKTAASHRSSGSSGAPAPPPRGYPPARPGLLLAVFPASGQPGRGSSRFVWQRRAAPNPQVSAPLPRAARRGCGTGRPGAAPAPSPDGCRWWILHKRTPFSRACLTLRGTHAPVSSGICVFIFVPLFIFLSRYTRPRRPNRFPLQRPSLRGDMACKMAVRCHAWRQVFDLRAETGLSSVSAVTTENVQYLFKTQSEIVLILQGTAAA